MARPLKEGFDYFPLLTSFFRNKKIRAFLRKPEPDYAGIITYLYLLCVIYEQKGYYVKADDDLIGDIAFDLRLTDDEVIEKMQFILEKGLLKQSSITEKESLLTSERIQIQFQEMSKKRGKTKNISVIKDLWLLDDEHTESFIEVTQKKSFGGKNEGFCSENPKKVAENTQSKVNKSKENEIKLNESKVSCSASQNPSPTRHKYGEYKNVLLSDEELEKLKTEFPEDWQKRIENLSEYIASSGKSYKNYLATIRKWAKADANKKATEKKQKSKFNNYVDTNKPDYSNFAQQLIEDMLDEA